MGQRELRLWGEAHTSRQVQLKGRRERRQERGGREPARVLQPFPDSPSATTPQTSQSPGRGEGS